MATELKLPDVGEGIEDVTINRWVIPEGGDVTEGDIVLEIATDKVDTEVEAPVSGKLLKIFFGEGELVDIDAVLAIIGVEGEEIPSGDTGAAQGQAESSPPSDMETASTVDQLGEEETSATDTEDGTLKASPVAKRVAAEMNVDLNNISGTGSGGQITKQDVIDFASQPAQIESGASESEGLPGDLANVPNSVVRRLAAENDIDLAEVAGGRPFSALTKYDVLSAIASRAAGEPVTVQPRFAPPADWSQPAPISTTTDSTTSTAPPSPTSSSALVSSSASYIPQEELVQLNRMRQAVARNTFQGYMAAPHVTTMHDVDMSAVIAHRQAQKGPYAAEGVRLTVTAYLIQAIVDGLRAVPAANSTWTDEGVVIKRYYNIGMAVALPQDQYGMGGLIVPVIKNAGDMNLMGIAKQVTELAVKARDGKLTTSDIQDGTFTLTNYGTSGSRFQTPIIVQPQVGILGTGALEKRPVVVSDGRLDQPNPGDHLIFKPMMTLGFSYDHRVLDGATADAFCVAVKNALESWA
ncbi:2-oxo acid dehydrogenase subunit E2 [Chloroflexi bacterium TSY]|nr:2-oxo acid dehydrogenase subunit E2 [Chloroflexi bacterium TSY]